MTESTETRVNLCYVGWGEGPEGQARVETAQAGSLLAGFHQLLDGSDHLLRLVRKYHRAATRARSVAQRRRLWSRARRYKRKYLESLRRPSSPQLVFGLDWGMPPPAPEEDVA